MFRCCGNDAHRRVYTHSNTRTHTFTHPHTKSHAHSLTHTHPRTHTHKHTLTLPFMRRIEFGRRANTQKSTFWLSILIPHLLTHPLRVLALRALLEGSYPAPLSAYTHEIIMQKQRICVCSCASKCMSVYTCSMYVLESV